ncbi:multidrug effflux MFS transporter [Luteolibacter sp. AS25]|uniref:multidrug effflux MFS transporter n=1 Tax=Luteolibacter sp. AS25 TaxID=3135776 RepID=UPI00398A8904
MVFNPTSSRAPLSAIAILVLALLSAVAPFATDMYLPGFTQISVDFAVSAASVQLTLTSFLIGLAMGQLIIGPLSDRYGRRKPLLIGTALAIIASGLCVAAPNIGSLIALRVLQGVGGAAGVVLARAIIADRAPDASWAARQMQIMMIIGGVAPAIAPITGTAIVHLFGWREVFVITALLSLVSFLGVIWYVDESLPSESRIAGGGRVFFRSLQLLAKSRAYIGYTFVTGFTFMALFGYISSSPFIYQNVLGFSATQYSLAFAINALGIVLFGTVSAKLVSKIEPRQLIAYGLAVLIVATLAILSGSLLGAGPVFMAPSIFFAVASVGAILGNANALAIRQVPTVAGTGSAVVGALQFSLGALASPIVGLGGKGNSLPMALVLFGAASAATLCFLLLTDRGHPEGNHQ